MKIWKQYKDSNYEVSTDGMVRNINTGRILKPSLTKGYKKVVLRNNGNNYSFYIHRLVAEVFLPNPQKLPQVNHKDENVLNNTVDNLEWCTQLYNNNYGTHNKRMGKTKSKTVLQLRIDGSLVRVWSSTHEVQRKLGYSRGNISNVCRGEVHSAYGFKWCYA